MKKKTIFLSAFLVALAGGWYGYSEYNREVRDLAGVKSQLTMDAKQLIGSFEKNEQQANAIYLDKIISVRGKVKTVEKNDQGFYSVILGDENSMSSVRCSMDPEHSENIASLSTGTTVTVKGACTGFNADELLGSDVILNRCVLD